MPYATATRARLAADVITRRIGKLDDRILEMRLEHRARFADLYDAIVAEADHADLQAAIAKRKPLEDQLVEAWDAAATLEGFVKVELR